MGGAADVYAEQIYEALRDARRLTLSGAGPIDTARPVELLDLEVALQDLERLDERRARVVELRFFGGLTVDETAAEDWLFARAWLPDRLRSPLQDDGS